MVLNNDYKLESAATLAWPVDHSFVDLTSPLAETTHSKQELALHTIYTRNNMGQKCEGNCGLWVLNEILKKTYAENLKKIVEIGRASCRERV